MRLGKIIPVDLWAKIMKRHASNRQKGVYGYMWWSAVKIIVLWFVILIPLILVFKHLIDLNALYEIVTDNVSDGFILLLFFVSESFLGLMPPDIFIIWTTKFSSPFLILALLGVLSYLGGMVSYYIGNWLARRPGIKAYSERALNKYIVMVRKWGGAFIIISAMFPFSPFSTVVIAVSLLRYPFRLYLLFAISRILRFLIQGVFYLDILNMQDFFVF